LSKQIQSSLLDWILPGLLALKMFLTRCIFTLRPCLQSCYHLNSNLFVVYMIYK
jgi:hypothetical protein